VWVHSTIYDTASLQPSEVEAGLPIECQYAYDSEQWMWITGSHCYGCGHDLWIYDANDLPAHKDAQNSGTKNDGVLGSRLLLAGGRMWLVVRPNGEPDYKLMPTTSTRLTGRALQVDLKPEFHETDTRPARPTLPRTAACYALPQWKLYYPTWTPADPGQPGHGRPRHGHGLRRPQLWVLSNATGWSRSPCHGCSKNTEPLRSQASGSNQDANGLLRESRSEYGRTLTLSQHHSREIVHLFHLGGRHHHPVCQAVALHRFQAEYRKLHAFHLRAGVAFLLVCVLAGVLLVFRRWRKNGTPPGGSPSPLVSALVLALPQIDLIMLFRESDRFPHSVDPMRLILFLVTPLVFYALPAAVVVASWLRHNRPVSTLRALGLALVIFGLVYVPFGLWLNDLTLRYTQP